MPRSGYISLVIHRPQKLLVLIASVILASALAPQSHADPVVDFFERVAKSAHRNIRKPAPARRDSAKNSKARAAGDRVEDSRQSNAPAASPAPSAETPQSTTPVPAEPVRPTPTPRAPVARATAATDAQARKGDLPYAVPVPNHPGFVTSPFAPSAGDVDVRGFASGAAVKDPYTGKAFLVP